MANETEAAASGRTNTTVVAIVVPSVFVVVLIMLMFAAFIVPRLGPGRRDDFTIIKEQRMKHRLEEINNAIKTQNYYDWLATQKEQSVTADSICAICLDEFIDDAQIRGLRCSHAFHANCLDEWFSRFNEFCPLCHRQIVPGRRVATKKMVERPPHLPGMFMV